MNWNFKQQASSTYSSHFHDFGTSSVFVSVAGVVVEVLSFDPPPSADGDGSSGCESILKLCINNVQHIYIHENKFEIFNWF